MYYPVTGAIEQGPRRKGRPGIGLIGPFNAISDQLPRNRICRWDDTSWGAVRNWSHLSGSYLPCWYLLVRVLEMCLIQEKCSVAFS